jgi:hypothetical protein
MASAPAAARASIDQAMTGRPAKFRQGFAIPGPARVLAPAATITAENPMRLV